MKVKNIKCIGGEVTETIYKENYNTPAKCRARIEEELEKTYGEDWEELHGNDLTTDGRGNPYYEFDMGEGDFERYEVVNANAKTAKAKVVKVKGCFTEWYAPTYKDPYEDNAEYAEFYDEKILALQPVIGPAVDGKDEYLSGDLGCLADRITCDAYDIGKWEEAKNGFADAVETALATGEPQTFKFEGLDDIKITPYAEVPVIPEKAYEVYGKFASLIKERVAAI